MKLLIQATQAATGKEVTEEARKLLSKIGEHIKDWQTSGDRSRWN